MQRDINDAWLRVQRPPAAGRLEVWDTRVTGLVLRITPSGAASWSVRLRTKDGKRTRPTLGAWPAVGIADARRRALTLIAAKRRSAPAMASLLYRTASAFLGHAEAHGWIATSLLPRRGLAAIAPPLVSRERVLTDEELRAVWRASGQLNPKPRAFVRLLILTAAREMEVADIAVGEVYRGRRAWIIPGARIKNGQRHVVPLCALALIEIQGVWPGFDEDAAPDWRLLGAVPGGGLRGFSKLKTRLDVLSGVAGWRLHDLRRTARTGMTRLGVLRDHAEAAINHVSGRSALERTYDRHDYAGEIVAALSRWQAHVAALVTAEARDADVAAPRRARAR